MERVMINPAELINARTAWEGWTGENKRKLAFAIHRLWNLKEFCNFQDASALVPILLPGGSSSTLRKLVLFRQELPHGLPPIIRYNRLDSFVIILPTFNQVPPPQWARQINLLGVVEEVSPGEVTIFAENWLFPTCWWFLPQEPSDGSEKTAEAYKECRSIIEQRIKFAMLPKPSHFSQEKDHGVEAVLYGNLWDLDRVSENTYIQLFNAIQNDEP